MRNLEYDEESFFRFHIKKGVEIHIVGEVVPIRSTSIEQVVEKDKPLIVTVEGKIGVLVIRPEDVVKNRIGEPRIIDDQEYDLFLYEWTPLYYKDFDMLNRVYIAIRKNKARIDKILKRAIGWS